MSEFEHFTARRIARLLGRERISVTDFLGIQSQFLRMSKWAAKARGIDLDKAPDRYFRAWTLRGTMHIHAIEDYALAMHEGNRSPYMEAYWSDHSVVSLREKSMAEDQMLRLVEEGVAGRRDILRAFERSGWSAEKLDFLFNAWGGLPRILMERREIVQTIADELSYAVAPGISPLSAERAEYLQMERYLRGYAPCSINDAAYFFHYTKAKAGELMRACVAGSSDELFWKDGSVFRQADEPLRGARSVHVLPGFDPLLLGYDKRENPMIPPEHRRTVYNLQGIVKPVVVYRGKCVATWTVRKGTAYLSPFSLDRSPDTVYRQAEEKIQRLTGCGRVMFE